MSGKQFSKKLDPSSPPFIPTQKASTSDGGFSGQNHPYSPRKPRQQQKCLPLISDRQFRELTEKGYLKAQAAHHGESQRIRRAGEAQAARGRNNCGGDCVYQNSYETSSPGQRNYGAPPGTYDHHRGAWTDRVPVASKAERYREDMERWIGLDGDEFLPAGLQ